jgi:hypothetical protein
MGVPIAAYSASGFLFDRLGAQVDSSTDSLSGCGGLLGESRWSMVRERFSFQ